MLGFRCKTQIVAQMLAESQHYLAQHKHIKNLRFYAEELESPHVGRDLDVQEEHAHHVGHEDAANANSHERQTHIARPRLLAGEVHHDQPHAAQHKHEPGRQPLDDVLPINAPGEKHHGLHRPRHGILLAANPGRLHDHIVHESRYHQEVREQHTHEHRHRRRQLPR